MHPHVAALLTLHGVPVTDRGPGMGGMMGGDG